MVVNGNVKSCSSSTHGVKEKYISSVFPNRYKKIVFYFIIYILVMLMIRIYLVLVIGAIKNELWLSTIINFTLVFLKVLHILNMFGLLLELQDLIIDTLCFIIFIIHLVIVLYQFANYITLEIHHIGQLRTNHDY